MTTQPATEWKVLTVSYIDQHLEPGERVLYCIQRSRKWTDLALTLAVDILAVLSVWLIFNQLQRAFVESYIRSTLPFEGAEFMVINLFLGILPFVFILGLAVDFILSFFAQLALTDGRIIGRVSGPFWMKEISFWLDEVEQVSARFGCLYVVAKGEKHFLPGFYDTGSFITAYRQFVSGETISAELFEPISRPVAVGK